MSKMPESEAWVDDERKRIQYTTKCVVGTHNKACGLLGIYERMRQPLRNKCVTNVPRPITRPPITKIPTAELASL